MNPRTIQPDAPDRNLRRRRARRGFALIAVLWVVTIGGMLLLGVNRIVSADLTMARNELESVRAHWLARSGVERAMAVLADDSRVADGGWDLWYSDEDSFNQVELIGGVFSVTAPPPAMADPATVRYGLVDLAGRLDLNTAQGKQFGELVDLESWQVAAIIDWRDNDNDSQPGGAEALHYQQLPYPYEIRNGPFQSTDELRLVHGMDGPAIAGEDANDNGVLDANEDDLTRSWPPDNGDGLLTLGLAGQVTVYAYELNLDGDGVERVNVNTVDAQELIDQFGFTKALAEGFTSRQSGSSRTTTTDGSGATTRSGGGGESSRGGGSRFSSLMDLLDVKPKKPSGDEQNNQDDDEGTVKEITLSWLAQHFDELTLTDDRRLPARVNVNTASPAVLRTLPEMDETTVETIVRRQDSGAGPFDSVGGLLIDEVLSEKQFKAMAEKVTVRSNVFEIRSTGVTRWGIRQEIVAVVDRGTNPMSILYWYQSE